MRLIILSISIYLLALTWLAHASTCWNNIVEFWEECDPIDWDTDLLELNTFCNSYCEIEDIWECLVNESTSVFDYNSDWNVDISSDLSFILDLWQALWYNNVDAIPTCENVQDTLCCPIWRVCDSNCDWMLTIQDYSIIAQNAQWILTTTTMCNVWAENYCATYYPTEPTW
jgi:hypothetical protein